MKTNRSTLSIVLCVAALTVSLISCQTAGIQYLPSGATPSVRDVVPSPVGVVIVDARPAGGTLVVDEYNKGYEQLFIEVKKFGPFWFRDVIVTSLSARKVETLPAGSPENENTLSVQLELLTIRAQGMVWKTELKMRANVGKRGQNISVMRESPAIFGRADADKALSQLMSSAADQIDWKFLYGKSAK